MQLTASRAYSRPQPVPKMPAGLVQLMEGLTRDVLQHSPPDRDLYEFCARHMEQLLVIRDGKVPKKKLPLDKRIKRAQERVRQKAEQRRRKYDEEMRKYVEETAKTINVSEGIDETHLKETAAKEQSSVMEEKYYNKKPVASEIEKDSEPITENKLKAPVHHEQELAEALEVEIFHKPIESLNKLNEATDTENSSESKNDDAKVNKETELHIDALAKNTNISENIVEGITVQNTPDRARRSVDSEGTAECQNNEHTECNITEDNNIEGSASLNQYEDKAPGELVGDTSEELSQTGHKITEPINLPPSDDATVIQPNNDILKETESEPDKTTVFADETLKLAPISETNNIELQITDVTVVNEKSNAISEPAVQFDETIAHKKIDSIGSSTDTGEETIEKNNLVTKLPIESNYDKENQNSGVIYDIDSTEASFKVNTDNNENEENELVHVNEFELTVRIDTKVNEGVNNSHAEKIEDHASTDQNHQSDKGIPQNNFVTNISTHGQKNEILALNDEGTVVHVQHLEVNLEPLNDEMSDVNVTTEFKACGSESKDNELDKEFPIKDIVIQDFTMTHDKELPREINDNESVPEPLIDARNSINGNHEITNVQVYENGDESNEPEVTSIREEQPDHEASKEKQSVSTEVILDDATTISEPIITDSETSSLGKCSSMDENCIQGVESEGDTNKTKADFESNKDGPSMDLETAAITIQKVFRTFMFKSRGSTFDDTGVDGGSIDGDSEKTEVEFPITSTSLNKERRTLGISRMDTVLQTVNEEKSLSLSTDDSSLSSAATIIQAHVRGFLVRNRLNSNKTNSSTSLVNSDGPSSTSLENDPDQKVNKTVLNIHIVPEGGHFLSRDESLLTSMELSLDGSPPSSTNLHPLGYDKSQPRKQLKREDAIQSISPPSNNSGKLSEDVDSVKDMLISDTDQQKVDDGSQKDGLDNQDDTPTKSTTIETVIEAHILKDSSGSPEPENESMTTNRKSSLEKNCSDENDVVTPYEDRSWTDSDATSRLLHSGEFHDVVLPTKVSRGDTSVVREFKNVLVYFLIWK